MPSCGTALGNNRFLLDLEMASGRSTCNSSPQYEKSHTVRGVLSFVSLGAFD